MLIELNDLSFGYAGSSENSLKDISLTVNEGEFIVLTGESGCGKTTLTRILNGLCPQFYNGEFSGSYLIDGRNGFDMSLDEIGTYIGNVFQDPRSQFFASNVTDEIVLASCRKTSQYYRSAGGRGLLREQGRCSDMRLPQTEAGQRACRSGGCKAHIGRDTQT